MKKEWRQTSRTQCHLRLNNPIDHIEQKSYIVFIFTESLHLQNATHILLALKNRCHIVLWLPCQFLSLIFVFNKNDWNIKLWNHLWILYRKSNNNPSVYRKSSTIPASSPATRWSYPPYQPHLNQCTPEARTANPI